MLFTEEEIEKLRCEVSKKISEKRFAHTLGVEEVAIKIGHYFSDIDISELKCAALLHDVAKELSEEEYQDLLKKCNFTLFDYDFDSPEIYHSFVAPLIIEDCFPKFSTERILSAVKNHTTGSYDMSIFDEIIFLADYIEEGRTNEGSINVRVELFNALALGKCSLDYEKALHVSAINSIYNTVSYIKKRGRNANPRTDATLEGLKNKLSALN